MASAIDFLPTISSCQAVSQMNLATARWRPHAGYEQHCSGFGGRQHGLRLDPPLELLVQPLDRVGGARALPLFLRQAGEAEQACARFLKAVGHGTVFDPPFANESLTSRFDLLAS